MGARAAEGFLGRGLIIRDVRYSPTSDLPPDVGLSQKPTPDVVEFRRFHALAALARARANSRMTRRGVSGVSLKLAPMPENASATALAIAAGGAMAPPSPRPLTPYSVVSAGVTRCSMRMKGISPAVGTR